MFEDKCACQNNWVGTYSQYLEVEQGLDPYQQINTNCKQGAN